MKKIIILFFAIALLSIKAQNDKSQFIGKWIADDNNEIGYVNFEDDGYAYFEIRGQILGGKEFTFEGKKGKMSYEINDESDPIEIDFTITVLETGVQAKLLCIANFIDYDTMEFAINFENKRPTDFKSQNSVVLKRVK